MSIVWSGHFFYFSHSSLHHKIVVYQFLSENEEEVWMYEHFCFLEVSFKKWPFKKNMILQKNIFIIIWVKIQVSLTMFWQSFCLLCLR